MAKWLLDVKAFSDRCMLLTYDEEKGVFEEVGFKLRFYGYVLTNDAEKIAHQLIYENLVEDAWVEEWFKPPFYNDKGRVLVFTTGSLGDYEKLVKKFKHTGFRVVNTHPHPLVEALYRAKLKPLTKLGGLNWSPRELDPVIDYVKISVENGFYVVESNSGVELIGDEKDLVYVLKTIKPKIVFSDKTTYVKLLNEDESIVNQPKVWVKAGPYHPHVVFEWCRLSYTPLSLMDNVTIGRLLSTMEALKARDWRYIVGREWSRVERFRSLDELLLWDRGGPIHQPKPGLYWNVCQIDFRSLYPSIMVKLNVSGETVNNPYCVNQYRAHYVPHAICMDKEGLVPSTVRGLIELKDLYENLFRETGLRVYQERRSAVKWILVASFGYLGYRNSMFGSISAHEVVTSTARFITAKAIEKTQSMGYRVIHTLIDSLFIEGVGSVEECVEVAKEVEKHVGYGLKVEAHYIWLYIPTSISTGFGASNKYYGALSTGGMKIKGVTIVRRDIPLFVKETGFRAFKELSSARNIVELREAVSRAIRVIEEAKEMILSGAVDTKLLVFSRVESRARVKPLSYVVYGKAPYRFLATLNGFKPVEEIKGVGEINYEYYVKLLDTVKRDLPSLSDLK